MVCQFAGFMMIPDGSRNEEPRWPFIALKMATALLSTVPRAHVVTPERPVMPREVVAAAAGQQLALLLDPA